LAYGGAVQGGTGHQAFDILQQGIAAYLLALALQGGQQVAEAGLLFGVEIEALAQLVGDAVDEGVAVFMVAVMVVAMVMRMAAVGVNECVEGIHVKHPWVVDAPMIGKPEAARVSAPSR
jgi:hypothetical protein